MLGAVFAAAWYKQVGQWLGDAGTTAAAFAAALVVAASVRGWYRRTLGSATDKCRRVTRLGTGAQLSFFTEVLGQGPAIKRTIQGRGETPATLKECFFVDRDYYVQTVSNEDGAVVAFSVTTRTKRFAPVFTSGRPQLTLKHRLGWELSSAWRVVRSRSLMARTPWQQPFLTARLGRTTFDHVARTAFDKPKWVTASAGGTDRLSFYSEGYHNGNVLWGQTHVFYGEPRRSRPPVP